MLLLAAVEIIYAGWLALIPDWATGWIAMLVLAGATTLYGAAFGLTMLTPPTTSLPLDMNSIRGSVRIWCSLVVVVTLAGTYLCGRTSRRWRRETLLRGADNAAAQAIRDRGAHRTAAPSGS